MSELVLVYTGNGKGKTTAALGLILRNIGHGHKSALIQFIKSAPQGEHEALKLFPELVEVYLGGAGFTWTKNEKEHEAKAKEAWSFAKELILKNEHQLIVLDEITYAFENGYLTEDDLIEFLNVHKQNKTIVLTGRRASSKLCEFADMVSTVEETKHHYRNGIPAQKGVEF